MHNSGIRGINSPPRGANRTPGLRPRSLRVRVPHGPPSPLYARGRGRPSGLPLVFQQGSQGVSYALRATCLRHQCEDSGTRRVLGMGEAHGSEAKRLPAVRPSSWRTTVGRQAVLSPSCRGGRGVSWSSAPPATPHRLPWLLRGLRNCH